MNEKRKPGRPRKGPPPDKGPTSIPLEFLTPGPKPVLVRFEDGTDVALAAYIKAFNSAMQLKTSRQMHIMRAIKLLLSLNGFWDMKADKFTGKTELDIDLRESQLQRLVDRIDSQKNDE